MSRPISWRASIGAWEGGHGARGTPGLGRVRPTRPNAIEDILIKLVLIFRYRLAASSSNNSGSYHASLSSACFQRQEDSKSSSSSSCCRGVVDTSSTCSSHFLRSTASREDQIVLCSSKEALDSLNQLLESAEQLLIANKERKSFEYELVTLRPSSALVTPSKRDR